MEKGGGGGRGEKVGHAEDIEIKGKRRVEVMHVDEDLADARKGRADWYWGSHESSLWLSPQKPGFLRLISTQLTEIAPRLAYTARLSFPRQLINYGDLV